MTRLTLPAPPSFVNNYFQKSFLLTSVRSHANVSSMWRKEDVIEKLKEDQGERSLREYAIAIGTSAGYLSDVYNSRREPGSELLDHLNIEKTVTVTYTPRKWRKS